MTITINEEIEAKLRQKAEREGIHVNQAAEALLSAALEMEETDRREAIQGIQKGLDAGARGRVRPASAVFADLRAKLQNERG
jgi:predicted transcriptional regulator